MLKLPYVGVEEITQDKALISKQLLAEFLGTLVLVLVACGSCVGGDDLDSAHQLGEQAQYVRIALCFGITVATMAQCIGHVSGCNINPAVTAGLITGGKVGLVRGLLYMVAQSCGAVAGAGLLQGLVAPTARGYAGLGTTGVSSHISLGQAVGIEFAITMVLVLTVFAAAADENNAGNVKGSAPLAIGLSITTCHLFAIPFTGSSMNPARSLGPAIITGNMTHQWIYWAGPLLGGICAAIIYQLAFQAPEKKEEKYVRVATDLKLVEA